MSKVTIYTIADELNMTPSMVSRAFDPNGKVSAEKRKLVLEAAKKYNFSPNRFASRLSMQTVKIGILISSRFSINFDEMILGITAAYEKLKDYKVTYDIKRLNPSVAAPEDYRKELLKFKNYNGVILSGMSSHKYTEIINELYELNPNIVQVQAINNDSNYLFSSKHNEVTASNLAADFLFNCFRKSERKNILLFTGDRDSALHNSAANAFESACKNYGLNVLESIDMKDNEEYFTQILPDIFKKYGHAVDGIYITSGFSAPLCKFLESNNIDSVFVAFDTYDEIKKYIQKGIISATIAQNVSKQMEIAFEKLVKYLIANEKPEKTVYSDIQVLLKSNF